MQSLWLDIKYGLRSSRQNPAFAAAAVLTLALGIAANTLVYSVVDSLVLNPFPYPEADRLVGIGPIFPKLNRELGFWEVLSPPEYLDIAGESGTLERIVCWSTAFCGCSRWIRESEPATS